MSPLYSSEPEQYQCPQHAELYAELTDEDLINYAHTTGCCAGQMDRADRYKGFMSDRSAPVRGGFRFHGEAEQAFMRGYLEELNGLTHYPEAELKAPSNELNMEDI